LTEKVDVLYKELKEVNGELWDVEEKIRTLTTEEHHTIEFIGLARDVIRLNDLRSAIRQDVNELLDSIIVEAKSY